MRTKFQLIVFFAVLAFCFQSCGDDSQPTSPKTAEELAIEALTGNGTQAWTVNGGSVKKNGLDVTNTYAGFELILNSGTTKTYTSKNSNDLFDSNGSWDFAGANFDKFILSGTKPAATREISFTESSGKLTLLFTIPQPGARILGTQAVAGNYEFVLLKK
ncbi:MAG: hypothetical protein LPK25_17175 [Cyclobacteriaceae bacterium]|nr:hypothetical protein [Cyclobacteriaceae bacterium]MDX5468084.1 hypothetical protein [Cyclobacteriaceae bacterium]